MRGPALLPPGGRPRDSTRLGSAERPGQGRGSQASDLTGDGAGARCNISAKWTPVCHRRGRKILTSGADGRTQEPWFRRSTRSTVPHFVSGEILFSDFLFRGVFLHHVGTIEATGV